MIACYVAIISKSLRFGNYLGFARKSALSGEACLKAIITKLTFFGNSLKTIKQKLQVTLLPGAIVGSVLPLESVSS